MVVAGDPGGPPLCYNAFIVLRLSRPLQGSRSAHGQWLSIPSAKIPSGMSDRRGYRAASRSLIIGETYPSSANRILLGTTRSAFGAKIADLSAQFPLI